MEQPKTFKEHLDTYGAFWVCANWPYLLPKPWRIAFVCAFPVTFPLWFGGILLMAPALIIMLLVAGIIDLIDAW